MTSGAANESSTMRMIAQVPHHAGSIVDRSPNHIAEDLGLGRRDDQAASLGQSHYARDTGKPSRDHDDVVGPSGLVDSSGWTDSPEAGPAARSLRSPDAIS